MLILPAFYRGENLPANLVAWLITSSSSIYFLHLAPRTLYSFSFTYLIGYSFSDFILVPLFLQDLLILKHHEVSPWISSFPVPAFLMNSFINMTTTPIFLSHDQPLFWTLDSYMQLPTWHVHLMSHRHLKGNILKTKISFSLTNLFHQRFFPFQ